MVEVPSDIARELAPSERVLRAGRPRQGPLLRGYDAFAIPFGLIWLGAVIAMIVGVLSSGQPDPGALVFMAFFVAIGLYLVVGRFFVEAFQRSRIRYCVSNERVIIISGVVSRSVKSIELKGLSEVEVSERRNGSGAIVFGATSMLDAMFGGMQGWPGMSSRVARFDLIPNVRSVYETIRSAQ